MVKLDKLPPSIIYSVAPGPPPPTHGPALPPGAVYHHSYDNMQHMQMEDYDDLMPDPMQFVSLMGAPPPPPMVPPPPSKIDKNEPVLPPGIDEGDVDAVPKPISDAPLPRKGPLPQDFQDALSIIFPGEKKPTDDNATVNVEQNLESQSSGQIIEQQPEMMSTAAALGFIAASAADEQSQHSMDMYGSAAAFSMQQQQSGAIMMDDLSFAEDVDIPDVATQQMAEGGDPATDAVVQDESVLESKSDPEMEKKMSRLDELNDLAMLGIDTDDLAAQCM